MDRLQPTLIYEALHGSRAYGLDREGVRYRREGCDRRPGRSGTTGFVEAQEQVELSADHVLFEVRKFMRLASAANPMSLELLFTDLCGPSLRHADGPPPARRARALSDSEGGRDLQRLCHGSAQTHPRPIGAGCSNLRRGSRLARTIGLPNAAVVPKDQLGAAEALIERGHWKTPTRAPTSWSCSPRETLQACAAALEPVPIVAGRPEPGARRTRGAARLRLLSRRHGVSHRGRLEALRRRDRG